MTAEEQYCLEMIHSIRLEYERAIKPYADRLVHLRRLEVRPIYEALQFFDQKIPDNLHEHFSNCLRVNTNTNPLQDG